MLSENDLKIRQSLSLREKIKLSIRKMEQFYYMYGDFYISVGGLDSTIVLYLARMSEISGVKNAKSVCLASCEPPNNIKTNKENGVELLKSNCNKMKLIEKWGYPLISKDVAMKISRYNRSKHEWAKERRLKGYMGKKGKWVYDSMIPKKYQQLIYAPFELSEHCCIEMKEKPLKQWEKKNNLLPVTGETVEESLMRKRNYLKHGCIMNKSKRIKCTPIAFWTEQDKVNFCKIYNVNYSKEYGDIIKENGKYKFTEERTRTGCVYCGFGILYDKNRFKRMKEKSINTYNYMMYGGQWIRKERYRWVKFRPNSIKIWSNLYFVPSQKGYGYKFLIKYVNELLNENIEL